MFLQVGKPPPAKKQRLYILDIELPSGMRVTKIGKASGHSSKERMLQINSSIFDKFRCTAKIAIKRDREVDAEMVFKYETLLHQFFANYRYETPHKWDGCTEAFVVPLEDAVTAYELIIEGNVPDFLYELPEQVEEPDVLS
jgi:hypothetical protein